MAVRHAGAPVTDRDFWEAARQGGDKRLAELFDPMNSGGAFRGDCVQCRLYPRLSFFFDGTGNNLEIDAPLNRLSNVAKLFNATANDRSKAETLPRYISGVGTSFKIPNRVPGYTDFPDDVGGPAGLGFGKGGNMRIDFAIGEFARLIELEMGLSAQPHIQYISLSVFGFSRGATGARAFVRRLIEQRCERTEKGLVWRAKDGSKTPLQLTFMGLFDTVASVGGPGRHMSWGAELAIPPEVQRCVHFVSAHEVREAFPLDSVRVGRNYPSNCEEVVYPGVHSDIGGGYAPDEQGRSNLLSRIPLRHMYAEALRAGVALKLPGSLKDDLRADYTLASDEPVVSLYEQYMSSLVNEGGDVESLIHAHRRLQFQWRGVLAKSGRDDRVLGRLYGQVNAAMCRAVPAATELDHPACSPDGWTYAIPRDPDTAAKQLLAEHRRLAQRIAFLRHPVMPSHDWPPPPPRKLTDYEKLLLLWWDTGTPVSPAVDGLLAEHVHDSVAAFTQWPCALHDPRGVFCDGEKYYAEVQDADSSVAAVA
jgi:Uncharacterized alpha/beta hydrolase domain (DUF2235)